jgi:hypothetical protein
MLAGSTYVSCMSDPSGPDWSALSRPPVVIAPEERESHDRQLAISATMTRDERFALASAWSDIAMEQRRARLRRRFPAADARGIAWAVIREALHEEPGTDPLP